MPKLKKLVFIMRLVFIIIKTVTAWDRVVSVLPVCNLSQINTKVFCMYYCVLPFVKYNCIRNDMIYYQLINEKKL